MIPRRASDTRREPRGARSRWVHLILDVEPLVVFGTHNQDVCTMTRLMLFTTYFYALRHFNVPYSSFTLSGFVRSWKTWESHGILKWSFPGLEKSWQKCNHKSFGKVMNICYNHMVIYDEFEIINMFLKKDAQNISWVQSQYAPFSTFFMFIPRFQFGHGNLV